MKHVTRNMAKQESGMVIILAILIIAAVLASAVLLNDIITREIRQSRLIDQSIQAYYYAESGSERALHQLRQREAIADCSSLAGSPVCEANSFCSAPYQDIPCINVTGGGLGAWQIEPRNEPQAIITLNEGETFQVDLFGPTQVENAQVKEIDVSFEDVQPGLIVELTNLTKILNVSGEEASNCLAQDLPVLKDFVSSAVGRFASLGGEDILSACSYALKVNYPLNGNNVKDSALVTISIFNDEGIQFDIPSRLIIDSSATYGNSAQTISVRTPIRPPLSGLYDFVLFSEADIIKLNN